MMVRCLLFVALLALVIAPIRGDRKRCFCDMRYSQRKLHHGDGIDKLPRLTGLPTPTYKHWLSVGCKKVLKNCPRDCRREAHKWMKGNKFSKESGQLACKRAQLNAPPERKIYVYAAYVPSVCSKMMMWQYLAPLCCWKVNFPGYKPLYLYNHMCGQRKPI